MIPCKYFATHFSFLILVFITIYCTDYTRKHFSLFKITQFSCDAKDVTFSLALNDFRFPGFTDNATTRASSGHV